MVFQSASDDIMRFYEEKFISREEKSSLWPENSQVIENSFDV